MNKLAKRDDAELAQAETEMAMVTEAEVISSVLAAQAKAETEARYVVAINRPRNIDVVRKKLLKECDRPGFAESGYYKVQNRGEGLSIRFAEAALRAMGNIDTTVTVVYDDDDKRVLKIDVIDMESNARLSDMLVIMKRIERKYLRDGEVAIRTRLNSYGQTVYLRQATDDEIAPIQGARISKSLRNNILRILPGDIQDECKTRILQIRDGDVPKDPGAQKRRVIDSFDGIGISIENLVDYLGHDIDSCSPSEFEELRNLFLNVKSGELRFHEVLEEAKAERQSTPEKKTKLEELTEKHGAKNDDTGTTEK